MGENRTHVKGQARIWAHFQNDLPGSFDGARPRLNYIIKQIARKGTDLFPRLLNIGAGNGYLEEMAQRSGWDIYSMDPDVPTIGRLIMKGVKGYVGRIEQMPFHSSSFDFVIASELLEHLTDGQRHRAIQEIHRVLKCGGWFLGTVPYNENLLANRVVCPECGVFFHRWGHTKSFDLNMIRTELSVAFEGLEVRRMAFVELRQRPLSRKIRGLIRLVLARHGAEIAFPSIYFSSQKRRPALPNKSS